MSFSALDHLECPRCGATYDATVLQGLCPARRAHRCWRGTTSPRVGTDPRPIAGRAPDLWRYHELLPVSAAEHVVTLGEGMTPLLPRPGSAAELGLPRLMVKDDGLLPTGSFKARGAAVGVSRAKELGATRLAMPTNGNAGAAWSTYAARAGLRATIAMPVDAPTITRAETVVTGGDLRLVDGLISDAGRLVGAAVQASDGRLVRGVDAQGALPDRGQEDDGARDRRAARLADARRDPLPDRRRGRSDRHPQGARRGSRAGLGRGRPAAAGLRPGDRVRADRHGVRGRGRGVGRRWRTPRRSRSASTCPRRSATSSCSRAVRETGGTAVAVEDADLLADLALTARLEGMFLCPEGAATVTAARQLARTGWLSPDDEVVLLNTGRRRDLPRHRHGRRPDDRQGRRAGAVTGRPDRCAIVLVAGRPPA